MFGFFKSKKQKVEEDVGKEAEKIVNVYGNAIQNLDYVTAFYDVKKLPYPKEKIANAIIHCYKLTTDTNMREILKTGLLGLSHFQAEIGDEEVRGEVDLTQIDITDISPEKFLSMSEGVDKERYQMLLQEAEKEWAVWLTKINGL
jgi:hypothetical protein